MFSLVLIVLTTMVTATLAVHLGLSVEVGKILTKILSCPKCLTFWGSVTILYLIGCSAYLAVVLSLLGAYIANWFGFMLIKLQKLYNKLWQRLNDK